MPINFTVSGTRSRERLRSRRQQTPCPGNRDGYHHALLRWVALLSLGASGGLHADDSFVRDGEAGFVLSHIEYALSQDAQETGACPEGMSSSVSEIFSRTPAGRRRNGESDADYAQRLGKGGKALATGPGGEDLCQHPEAGKPDPYFHTVEQANIPAFGIDIDGVASSTGAAPAPNTCPHDDLIGMNGEPGIDNQFFRVVGCNRSFQSTGQSNTFATEMLTGSWGILLTLAGVDDIYNDDSIEVGFYSNADPIKLSPTRVPLAYATYLSDPDPRFRATAHGRITNGVLTTDPTDVRFHYTVNSMLLERPLRRARLQATLSNDGEIEGYLAGYAPLEELYDLKFGFRNGKTSAGELAPLHLRSLSSNGAAFVLGHTCTGAYHALYAHADGDPDPQTGKCTSISMQYRVRAIPAFVVDSEANAAQAKVTVVSE